MAFDSIRDFFARFGRSTTHRVTVPCGSFSGLVQEIEIRELAFNSCVNLVASCVSKCELRTYKKNQFIKDDWWYRLNVQPNPNTNATTFWKDLIEKLYREGEALVVIRPNRDLYIADSFTRNDSQAFNANTYSGIMIDSLNYQPTLTEDQVFYFTLTSEPVKALVDKVTGLYAQLIQTFVSSYTNTNGTRGILYIDQIAEQEDGFEDRLSELITEDFKKLYTNPNAVLPLFDGYKYEELSRSTSPGIDTRDFHSQIQDVFELYATAFNIPKSLVTGDVQDTTNAMDNLLTFVLDPVLEMIGNELNRKIFSKEDFTHGDCVKWRTNAVRHVDVLSAAGNVEKLVSSGFCCIDDLREICGMDKLNTEWSRQFFMTKNFSSIENLLVTVEGGENSEQRSC